MLRGAGFPACRTSFRLNIFRAHSPLCEDAYIPAYAAVLARLPEAGHGAMLSPLPPLESGSVAERLLGDPPRFDRMAALPPLHAAIAEFFVQRLGPAR